MDSEDLAVLARRQSTALREVARILEQHLPEEVGDLRSRYADVVPESVRSPHTHAALADELLLLMARLLHEHIEQTKPRPRGRPPKRKEND